MDNNVQINGALVSEPCTLEVNDNTLSVDFGTIIEKQLYQETRTKGVPFSISLKDCDTSLGKSVNLTFNGKESTALPGLLVADGDGAAGIAIGMETQDDKPIALNQVTPAFALQDGSTIISLKAYVQAEPEALSNQGLVAGSFSAVATIAASYP